MQDTQKSGSSNRRDPENIGNADVSAEEHIDPREGCGDNGDNIENSHNSSNQGSDGELRNPVVTFVGLSQRSSANSPPTDRIPGVAVGDVMTCAHDLPEQHPSATQLPVADEGARMRIFGRHSRHKAQRQQQADALNLSKSYSTLERLRSDVQETLSSGPPPVNTPIGTMPDAQHSMVPPLSVGTGQHGDVPISPQQSIHAHWSASVNQYQYQQPEIAAEQLRTFRRRYRRRSDTSTSSASGSESSSSESSSSNDNDSDSSSSDAPDPRSLTTGMNSPMEAAWFERARTFSVRNGHSQADANHSTLHRMTGSALSLPRVTTVASAREKDGLRNRMAFGSDDGNDMPALGLGPEMTNDLRNIQLTFSRQSINKQKASPLKHLIRSKHNFRALVSYGGYLIPINVLLNVILLGRGWMQYNEEDAEGNRVRVENPSAYLITSIMSLVLIVGSGVCFILRCLEYSVVITTMTSIFANFVNAALIIASAIFYLNNERPKHPNAQLTGEYYCSYAGAAVGLLNATLLLLDLLVTPGFRFRGSGMSRQQRLLQFNIIVIVVWIGIGGYAWSKIEGWDTITSVMFCMVTVTTIGFGNKSPSPGYSRILQLIYGPLGILLFGLMLLNTRDVVIQITRRKIRLAKRDFEAKRKKFEQDVALNQVKRRLAARLPQRTWKATLIDLKSRILFSRSHRLRIGIPNWLRKKIDEESVAAGDCDLEVGKHLNEAGKPENVSRPHETLSLDPAMPAEQTSARGMESSMSATRDGPVQLQGQGGVSEQHAEPTPLPMLRTYTTASRISQIRDALSQQSAWQRFYRRILYGGRKRSEDEDGVDMVDEESDGDHGGNDSDDSRHRRFENGVLSNDDEDSDHCDNLHADQTLQPESGDMDRNTDRRFKRVMSMASAVGTKVKDKAWKRGKGKLGQRRNAPEGLSDPAKYLFTAILINICFWCASASIFYAVERRHWSYFDALYFCYVAYTTIGYGDTVPSTTEGNIVFICLIFVAVALETFLVVSAVNYFTQLINRTMRRTRVQKRITKRQKSLVAYEIRRHIKHPNYNPFGVGEEDRMVQLGLSRLKRGLKHAGNIIRGKKSAKHLFSSQRTVGQRQRDESLTEGFIRHTTGLGGFNPSGWQPPSPQVSPSFAPSIVQEYSMSPQPTPASHSSDAEMSTTNDVGLSRSETYGHNTTATKSEFDSRSNSDPQISKNA